MFGGPGGGKVTETDKLNIDSIIARLLEGENVNIYKNSLKLPCRASINKKKFRVSKSSC